MKPKIVYIDPLPHTCAYTPQAKFSGYTEIIPAMQRLGEFQVEKIEYCKANAFLGPKKPGIIRDYSILPRGIPWITSRYYTNPTAEIRALLQRPSIIHHINSEDTFFLHGLMRKHRAFKLVATVHLPLSKFFVKLPRTWKRYFNNLDFLITLASREYKFFKSQLDRVNVVQIPHGNNNNLFRASELNPNLGVCIGGHLRDFQTLVKAMKKIRKVHPNFVLYIISRRKPPNFQFPDIQNIRPRFNISDDALIALYQKASLMILPLEECTANNALLESLASGIPIITNKVGGTTDYLDESCACFFQKGDTHSLTNKLEFFLDNPQEIKKMSRAAIEKSRLYDWEEISRKIKNEVYLH